MLLVLTGCGFLRRPPDQFYSLETSRPAQAVSAPRGTPIAIDGVEYEVDLSAKNAQKLRDAVTGYAEKARKVRGGRGGPKATSVSQVDTKAVRAWAKSNNIELSSRGRIPADVVDQYRQAGN